MMIAQTSIDIEPKLTCFSFNVFYIPVVLKPGSASDSIVQEVVISPRERMEVYLSNKAFPVELLDDFRVSETRKTKKLNH